MKRRIYLILHTDSLETVLKMDVFYLSVVLHVITGNVICTTVADVVEHVCMPHGTDRLVYRYKNNTHVFVGFDDIKHEKLFSVMWEQTPGNPGELSEKKLH